MTIKALWTQYQDYTESHTEHARKLAFADAVVCWFFKSPDVTFPPAVLGALALLVVFFVLDLMHYFVGALCLKSFAEAEEQRVFEATNALTGDEQVDKPRFVDKPAFVFWILKTLALLASFGFLGTEFGFRILRH